MRRIAVALTSAISITVDGCAITSRRWRSREHPALCGGGACRLRTTAPARTIDALFLDRSAARLLLAVIAALALHVYGNRRIVAEDFALAPRTSTHEDWNGTRFTASSPRDRGMLHQCAAASTTRPATVLWLRESRLSRRESV